MTPKERFLKALNREPVDVLPYGDGPWGETVERYTGEGHLQEGEDFPNHFGMAWRCAGWLNSTADLDFEPKVLEETEDTILILDGNGAQLRTHKCHSGTPEHVDFTVKERGAWKDFVKPHLLQVDERRIPFESYRQAKAVAAKNNQAFLWSGVAPFEQMHPVCGHEFMLMGMALDPEWVEDMVMTYAEMTISHLKRLFEREGKPDAIWFYEDMGFKDKPFMSPDMYRDIVQPGHALLFGYAHSLGIKVIVHSCGFVEPLVPGLIEAGMDCLQAMEVKAGMDLPHLFERFGDTIAFCGGIDVRVLAANDLSGIDAELEKKVRPIMEGGGGYILHSDHSIPPQVNYETLKYFFAQGNRFGNGGI